MKDMLLALFLFPAIAFGVQGGNATPLCPGCLKDNLDYQDAKAEAEAFVLKWFKAFEGGAAATENLLTFYSDDVVYQDPNVWPNEVKGKDNLRRTFRAVLANYPNWSFTHDGVYPTENGIILKWVTTIPDSNGKMVEGFSGIDVLEFDEEGKIKRHEDFFDIKILTPPRPEPRPEG